MNNQVLVKIIPECVYCKYYRHFNYCDLFKKEINISRNLEKLCGKYAKYFERRTIDKNELLK
jgi:hypothetical protein